jgi:hypothetical protein
MRAVLIFQAFATGKKASPVEVIGAIERSQNYGKSSTVAVAGRLRDTEATVPSEKRHSYGTTM